MSNQTTPLKAYVLAVIAWGVFIGGSLLVGDLWIGPQQGNLRYQAQYDAAAYGVGLLWPATVICFCLLESIAFLFAHVKYRFIAILSIGGILLIAIPYTIAFKSSIIQTGPLPLQGAAAGLLAFVLLVVDVAAIYGSWYCLRYCTTVSN